MPQGTPPLLDRVSTKFKNNPLVVVGLIFTAVVAAGASFINNVTTISGFFSEGETIKVTPVSGSKSPRTNVQSPAGAESFSPVTFEEYLSNAVLNPAQTTLQRNTYIKSVEGRRVVWRGRVAGITQGPKGSPLVLLDSSLGNVGFAVFVFQPSDTAQLLTLKKGDVVELTGVVGEWLTSSWVEVTDSQLLRVHTP